MKRTMTIAAIALMMAGSYGYACSGCGCEAKKAEKGKSECSADKGEQKQTACGGSKKAEKASHHHAA